MVYVVKIEKVWEEFSFSSLCAVLWTIRLQQNRMEHFLTFIVASVFKCLKSVIVWLVTVVARHYWFTHTQMSQGPTC